MPSSKGLLDAFANSFAKSVSSLALKAIPVEEFTEFHGPFALVDYKDTHMIFCAVPAVGWVHIHSH